VDWTELVLTESHGDPPRWTEGHGLICWNWGCPERKYGSIPRPDGRSNGRWPNRFSEQGTDFGAFSAHPARRTLWTLTRKRLAKADAGSVCGKPTFLICIFAATNVASLTFPRGCLSAGRAARLEHLGDGERAS